MNNRFCPLICRNIKLIIEFNSSFQYFWRLMCQSACCIVMSTCHQQSSMCKWTILMEMLQISLLTFHFQFFSVFPLLHILPSSHFIQKHQTSPGLFSFPLKPSPSSSSSLKNHHLHQSTLEKIPF